MFIGLKYQVSFRLLLAKDCIIGVFRQTCTGMIVISWFTLKKSFSKYTATHRV